MSKTDYCGTCCSAAKEAGRTVRLTQWYEFPVCGLCESRLANGLVHYQPSNGTEMSMFSGRCDECRHFDPGSREDYKVKACKWGILDKLNAAMWEGDDSGNLWFDPKDLKPECPADCLRFTPKDYDGDDRDPPKPDVPGQLTWEDALEVTEQVPELPPSPRASGKETSRD